RSRQRPHDPWQRLRAVSFPRSRGELAHHRRTRPVRQDSGVQVLRGENRKMTMADFPIAAVRAQFPALERKFGEQPAVYFDGPAGSQTPLRVVGAIGKYLVEHNANHGGVFATSVENDALLHEAQQAAADFVGASDSNAIVFGANMTTLTFAFSRALAQTWRTGDEIIV